MSNPIPKQSPSGLKSLIPAWLRSYQKPWLKADVVAGVTTAAVVIPNSVAYATVAGLPVEAGLYTSCVPMAIYALLGTSRALSVSTTTTLAILCATALSRVVPDGNPAALLVATATLATLVGIMLTVASVLRLGFVANFISEPVLIGFKAGIAIIIISDQLPKLLGIHFQKGGFFHNVLAIVTGLPHASPATVAVGVATLGVLLALRRFLPQVPAPLVAVAGAILATVVFRLPAHGVATVGHVPTGLPSVTMPNLELAGQLWHVALGMALMSFTESIAAGRAFARVGEHAPLANRELIATGLANLGGALLGAMPAGGGTTQTAVNRRAGACTQAAGLVTAAVALATMLLLSAVIGLIPHAALAAVVIVYSVGLFNPVEFRAIAHVRRTEFAWAIVALAGVVLVGTLEGILIAIVVSLVALAYQVSDPPVYVLRRKPNTNVFRPVSDLHPNDESFPGLLLLRPEGRIFFANVEHVGQKIRSQIIATRPTVVAVDLGGVFDIEHTALKMFTESEQKLRAAGITLWIANLNPNVYEMLHRAPLGATLGRERMFFTLEQAVARYAAITTAHAVE
jgi:sulfate permease, SulP family